MAREALLELLRTNDAMSVKELSEQLGLSRQAVHKSIKQLLEAGLITKIGRSPHTYYKVMSGEARQADKLEEEVDEQTRQLLQAQFMHIDELGNLTEGLQAFVKWCTARKLPILKTIEEFSKTVSKYRSYYDQKGLIDGIQKLRNTNGFSKIHLDELYYLDFYAIERFGKTRLGTLLHFAKQGQNKYLMGKLVKEATPKLNLLLARSDFEAVAFVPPTIRREVQLMKYLETRLRIKLPQIRILKLSGIIPVPQKALSKITERISNAEHSFAVTDRHEYNHVLLIDDAVGSGATLNQIAGKLKKKQIAKSVTGLAIVGSLKGFDIITDL